ncbi:MAG TPA: hypothetical protein VJ112_02065, partial [Rhabdochlamydiaceae bacterium]|nr:hypothetical protein [Rhabdochlamydiaceae bacterium]
MSTTTQTTFSDASQFFHQPVQPTPPPPAQNGFLRNWGGWALGGVGRAIFFPVGAPVKAIGSSLAEGLGGKTAELLDANKDELTAKVDAIFSDALLRNAPPILRELDSAIEKMIKAPSKVNIEKVSEMIRRCKAEDLQAMDHTLAPEGIGLILNIPNLLMAGNEAVTTSDTAPETYQIKEEALQQLLLVKQVLRMITLKNEGALFKTLDYLREMFVDEEDGVVAQMIALLMQKISEEKGPIAYVRHQIFDPKRGILPEATSYLRDSLCAKPHPDLITTLRELKALKNHLIEKPDKAEILAKYPPSLTALTALLAKKEDAISGTSLIEDDLMPADELCFALASIQSDPGIVECIQAEQLRDVITLALIPLERCFQERQGIIEESGNLLIGKIEDAMRLLEKLPRRMAQDLLGATATTETAATIPTDVAAATLPLQSFPVALLASHSQDLLGYVMKGATSAFSHQALNSLAGLLSAALKAAKSHVEQQGLYPHVATAIQKVFEKVDAAKTSSSWPQILAALKEGFELIREQQVYLQGLRIPLGKMYSSTSSISHLLENISGHEKALKRNPQVPPDQKVTEAMVEEKELMLKKRITAIGPLRFVYEKVCALTPEKNFYAEILALSSSDIAEADTLFKTRFFAHLDSLDIPFLQKMLAKGIFLLMAPVTRFYAGAIMENIFSSLRNWNNGKSASTDRENQLIERLRNWLAVLSGSYNEVAKQEKVSGDIKQMLMEVLQTPEHNGGLTQRQLHRAVISKTMDVYGPKMQWRAHLSKFLMQAAFPQAWPISSTLNIPLKAVTGTINWLQNTLLAGPEFLVNFAIQGVAKLFLTQSDLLPAALDRSFSAMQKNTPTTYAYNLVIYHHLQRIWQTLQTSFPTNPSNAPSPLASRQSNIKKNELKGLIEYLFEVLDKSKCKTQDKLRELLYEKSLYKQIEQGIDEQFMQATMETAVTIIALTLETVADKEGYDELVYSALCTANEVFDMDEEVSEAKLIEIEQANTKLTDQILDFAIYQALSHKFDFTGERQKLAAANFIADLKKDTSDFVHKMHSALEKHRRTLTKDITGAKEPLKDVLELSMEFQRSRAKLQSEADGNLTFHTETKMHLNDLSLQMSKILERIGPQLNEMHRLQEDALLQNQVREELSRTLSTLLSLEKIFSDSSPSQTDVFQTLAKMHNIYSSFARLVPIVRLLPTLR